jgi:hypothetical protein
MRDSASVVVRATATVMGDVASGSGGRRASSFLA